MAFPSDPSQSLNLSQELAGLSGIYAEQDTPPEPVAPSPKSPLSPNPSVPYANPSAPAKLDPYTSEAISNVYKASRLAATPPPKEAPHGPQPVPYAQARAAAESSTVEGYIDRTASVAGIPTKDKLAYVTKFLETPSVNITGLKEAPLTGAYQLAKLAEEQGYRVVFQSGKRDKGGKSYHDHGEAVDVRFQKIGPDGVPMEITPKENVALGIKLGKQAGFASALDEFHYWGYNGAPKSDPWNNSPHVHLAWGEERSAGDHPMHHKLANRYWTDKDYLVQPAYKAASGIPYKEPGSTKKGDRNLIPGMVEIHASAMGLDPDIMVSLVSQESSFNPEAVSPAGARGLMQMMPATLKEVAPKVGITEAEYYKSPRAQLKAGMYYFKQKLEENGGNYPRAVAAYNAGMGGLEEIKNGKNYAETTDYVFQVMKNNDPTITTPEEALAAIRNGTGRTRNVKADREAQQAVLREAQNHVKSIWDDLISPESQKAAKDSLATLNPFDGDNYANPLSGVRQAGRFINEILNDGSFGIIPMADSSREAQIEGDQTLKDFSADSWLAKGAQGATTLGGGFLRGIAGAVTGGILAKALRYAPLIGAGLKEADLIRKGMEAGIIPEAIAAEGGLLGKIKGFVAGGPMELFTANLSEQATVGALAMSSFHVSNYLWNKPEDATGADLFQHVVVEGLGAAAIGALVSAGAAIGVPLMGGTALSIGSSALGIGKANMADNAINVISKEFQALNPTQRILGGALGGSIAGAFAGATSDIFGLTHAITGEDPGVLNSMLQGGRIGGAVGGLGGLSAPLLAQGLDHASTSALMNSPGVKAALAPIKGFVQKMNDKTLRVVSQEILDAAEENLKTMARSRSHANASLHASALDRTAASIGEQYTQQEHFHTQLTGKLSAVEAQAKQLSHFEGQVDAKYPRAAAFELDRDSKLAQVQTIEARAKGKPNPAQQAQIAKIKQDLAAAEKAIGGDKDLLQERNYRNTEIARLKSEQAKLGATKAQLQKDLEAQQTILKGLRISQEENLARSAYLKTLLADPSTEASALDEVFYGLKREGAWNIDKRDPVSALLNPEAENEGQAQALNSLLSRQSQAYIRRLEAGETNPELRISQNIHAEMKDTTPEEFFGSYQSRLADAKKRAADLEAAKPKPTASISNAAGLTKWKKSSGHYTRWETSIPKDHKVVVADAAALRAGILKNLESSGATVERGTLLSEAAERANDRFIAPSSKVPSFDKSKLIELAKDAESMLQMQETTLPVLTSKADQAELAALLKDGHEVAHASAQADLAKTIQGLEDALSNRFTPKGEISPLTTGPKDASVPLEGGLAAGAILDHIYRPELSWKSAAANIPKIEKTVREKLGVFGDLENFTHFVETGNVSLLPDEVAKFVKSGGDLSSAPESVKAWSDAVTLARMEEVGRLRQLEGFIIGNNPEGETIMSSIRVARAGGYTPPEFGSTPDSFLRGLESTSTASSQAKAASNKVLMEIASSDKPSLWKSLFPLAQDFFRDHIYSHHNALSIIKERMITPKFAEVEKNLVEKLKPSGKLLNDIHKDFLDAIEDTGLLREFKKNHPEADELVETYYSLQGYMESLVASSPKLKPWIQANYVPQRFRKLAAHAAAATAEERISLSARMAEAAKKYGSMKDIEAAVKTVSQEVKDAGFTSTSDFINMGMEERAKRLKFFKDPDMDAAWKALDDPGRQAAIKDSESKLMTLLLQDPVQHPRDLVEMQLSAIFQANTQREFLSGLSRLPVLQKDGSNLLHMVEGVEDNHTYSVVDPSGNTHTYHKVSELPGFTGARLELNGKEYKSSNILIHPEGFRFLKEHSLGNGYSSNRIMRYAQRMQSIFRNSVLMGTFIPFNMQILGGHMMDFVRAPLKMMGMNVAGANLGMGDTYSQAAMTANAALHGLNLRSIDQVSKYMSRQVIEDFGYDVSSRIYGMEDKGFGRFLQSLDVGDPMREEARALLSRPAQAVSDVLGIPARMDYMMNREMLFKPIEMGQLAGFHLRAQRYLLENADKMKHLSAADQMRMAFKESADRCNSLSGAMPHIYQNSTLRQAASASLLTPSWFLSKAYNLADSIDSLIYLGTKGIRKAAGAKMEPGEGGFSPLSFLGRQPFEHIPAATRDATRGRMAKMLMAGLAGSFAMTQAAQYFSDGTLTTDHPPDKLFHIRMGDEYVTGPVVGFVKDALKFGMAASSEDGYEWSSPSLQSVFQATVDGFLRQLNPSVEAMARSMIKDRKGEVLDSPDVISTFLAGAAQSLGGAPLETLGIEARQFHPKNIPGYLGMGGPEQKKAAESSMLKSRNYLLRQLGAYPSTDNLDMQIRGDYYDRFREQGRQHRSVIKPLLDKAKMADSAEEQARWLGQAYDRFYEGVRVKDSKLKQYFPDGTYRITEKEFESMLKEAFSPQTQSVAGLEGTPMGLAVQQTRALYGR